MAATHGYESKPPIATAFSKSHSCNELAGMTAVDVQNTVFLRPRANACQPLYSAGMSSFSTIFSAETVSTFSLWRGGTVREMSGSAFLVSLLTAVSDFHHLISYPWHMAGLLS